MCDLVAPLQSLPIALGQSNECAPCPEGIADVSNGAFHAAFLIAGADLAGARREMSNEHIAPSGAG